jgi:hypothetical protein
MESVENILKIREACESLTVEQLEDLILAYRDSVKRVKNDEEIGEYLLIRQRKINSIFEWTSENIDKLLRLDEKLTDCFEKLRDEASPIVQALQERIDEKDTFLHDFEIEAKVKPYILVPGEDGTLCEADSGMERILSETWGKWQFRYNCKYLFKKEKDNLYLDNSMSWNIPPLPHEIFAAHNISYAIHVLCADTFWSFSDIVRINHLWSELKIWHQNFEDL